MKKKIKKLIYSFLIILLLSVIQLFFISQLSISGVKPNLSLIGLTSLLNFLGINTILFLSALSGLIYGIYEFYFIPVFLSFILSVLIIVFLKKRFLSDNSYLTKILSIFLITIIFNFLFVFLNLILFNNNFFKYFFSFSHLIEIFFNIFVFIILDFIIVKIMKEKFFYKKYEKL